MKKFSPEDREELIAIYRGAKDKAGQVKILSELYNIPQALVQQILEESGFKIPEKKRIGRPKGTGTKKPPAGQTDAAPDEPMPLPEPKEAPQEENPAGATVTPWPSAQRVPYEGPRVITAEDLDVGTALRREEFDRMLDEALAETRKTTSTLTAPHPGPRAWTVREIKSVAFDVLFGAAAMTIERRSGDGAAIIQATALALGDLIARLDNDGETPEEDEA